jgi:hypothetical protein
MFYMKELPPRLLLCLQPSVSIVMVFGKPISFLPWTPPFLSIPRQPSNNLPNVGANSSTELSKAYRPSRRRLHAFAR